MISYIIVSNNQEILAKNILKTLKLRDADEMIVIRDAQGIAEAYNRGARQAKNTLKCFIHHDVIVLNSDKLREELILHANPGTGMVGIVGTTHAEAVPWWDKGDIGSVFDTGGGLFKFSETGGPCGILDGLLLATCQPMEFDERMPGYHMYDHDICQQMLARGLRNYCLDNGFSLVLHNTPRTNETLGSLSDNMRFYRDKWKITPARSSSIVSEAKMDILACACPEHDLRNAGKLLPQEFSIDVRNLDALYSRNAGKLILSLDQGPEALLRQFASRAGLSVVSIEPKEGIHRVLLKKHPAARPSVKLTSIVMLSYGKGQFTAAAIASIHQHTASPIEIIVVDNASPDKETVSILQELKDKSQIDRLVLNQTNVGVPAGWNQGLALARGDFLAVLNNDILVTPGWLEALINCVESEPRAGLAGSRTNSITGPQLVFHAPNNQQTDLLLPFAERWGQLHKSGWWKTYRLRGFAIVMPKEVWKAVGPFDEMFGQGNFEDDDMCLRMLKLGYDLYVVDDSYIHHFGSLSFGDSQAAYQELLWKNQDYFIRKWRNSDHDLLKKVAIQTADRTLMEYSLNLHTLQNRNPEIRLQPFAFTSSPVIMDLYRK